MLIRTKRARGHEQEEMIRLSCRHLSLYAVAKDMKKDRVSIAYLVFSSFITCSVSAGSSRRNTSRHDLITVDGDEDMLDERL